MTSWCANDVDGVFSESKNLRHNVNKVKRSTSIQNSSKWEIMMLTFGTCEITTTYFQRTAHCPSGGSDKHHGLT